MKARFRKNHLTFQFELCYTTLANRGVAQFGSALGSGPRGTQPLKWLRRAIFPASIKNDTQNDTQRTSYSWATIGGFFMATLTKREGKKGITYQIRVVVGYDEFNKQVQKTTTWKNPDNLPETEALAAVKKFAEQFECEAKVEFAKAQAEEADKKVGKIQFAEFVSNYWLPLYVEDGEKKPTTVADYKNHIKPSLEFFGKAYLTSITPLMVDKFLKWVRTEYKTQYQKAVSEKSIRHFYITFNNVLKYAKKLGFITELPTAETKTPQVHKKKVVSMSKQEAQDFIQALNGADLEFKAKMYILLTSGLRRGEVLGLQWQDIDFMNGTASIERNIVRTTGATEIVSTPKTEGSVREVPLTGTVLSMLAILRTRSKSEWVFEYRKPDGLTKKLKRFMKANGLPDYSPHDLRHTCATMLNANNVDIKTIQLLLGHADASTTLNYYIGVEKQHIAAAVNDLAKTLAV